VKRIRAILADDHAIVRDGIAALLRREPDLDLAAEVGDGEAALERILALRPDVAVVDLEMPRLGGVEVARKVRDQGLGTAVVILSMHKEPAFVRAALDAGAMGYVLKHAATAEMLVAVRAAAAGEVYLSPAVAGAAVEALRNPRAAAPVLSPRERDVLRLLARGLSSKEIAHALSIGTRTVDGYRASIMDKLEVRSVPGLVKWAIKNGLASLDDGS
jgi:DNA-binding NarL/FixJ family response regulator